MSDLTDRGKGRNVRPVLTGEMLKDDGIRRATAKNPAAILEIQLGLLTAIYKLGTATVDDAEDDERRATKFEHRGLRGAATVGLVKSGLIVRAGKPRKSLRPSRHHGENRPWRAKRPATLPAAIAERKAQLRTLRQMGGVA